MKRLLRWIPDSHLQGQRRDSRNGLERRFEKEDDSSLTQEAMTLPEFRERFIESKGQPIEHEGREVHVSVRVSVHSGDSVSLTFKHATPTPLQGLRIIAKNCVLESLGEEGKQFVIWRDTAPDRSEYQIQKAKSGAEVVLMNVWRDEMYGSTMHGLNNAGIQRTLEADGSMVLKCSDGWGPPQFDDLVVLVNHRNPTRA